MDLGLERRMALITGSSSGLGRVIANTLAKEGVDIIINGRNKEKIDRACEEIAYNFKVNTYSCCADVTRLNQINAFFSEVLPKIGKLDILVNNAGNLEIFGTLFSLEEEDWLRTFDLTFMSFVRFSLLAHPWLKQSGHGRVINIGSIPAHQPGKANPHYAAAKAAILPISKMMANEFAKDNILVNIVCPSTLRGGGWDKNVALRAQRDDITSEEAEKLMGEEESRKSPLGRMGALEDVADFVVFLASDKASFVTGQCFNIDGGLAKSIL